MGKKGKTGIGFVDNAVKAVGDVGKNIESYAQGTVGSIGSMFNGNFDNLGSTLLRMNPMTAMTNQRDMRRMLGSTNMERRVDQATEAAQKAEAQDIANQQAEVLRQNAEVIAGAVSQRSRTPGRSMTLLNQPGSSNTLLTVMGR